MPWRFDGLSHGERKKLQVAVALGQRPDALVIDEPTNQIDLHSVKALERALAAYPGALQLVSHDHAFLGRCTARIRRVAEGRVREAPAL